MRPDQITPGRTLHDWSTHRYLTPTTGDFFPPLYNDLTATQLAQTGIALDDILAWADRTAGEGGLDPDTLGSEGVDSLRDDLVEATGCVPNLTVRAALGWAMAGAALPDRGWSTLAMPALHAWLRGLHPDDPQVADYALWLGSPQGRALVAEHAEAGWMFAAAGLGRDEAPGLGGTDALAGAVDGEVLLAMAALRGVLIPRTP